MRLQVSEMRRKEGKALRPQETCKRTRLGLPAVRGGWSRSMSGSRKGWTDYMATRAVQAPLIDASELPEQPKRRRPGTVRRPVVREIEVQRQILTALALHPKVARIERINVMAGRLVSRDGKPSRFMRSCRRGRVDLDGFTRDGKIIAIEVKTPARRNTVTAEQRAYLDQVSAAGGLAGVACSVEEARAIVEGRS